MEIIVRTSMVEVLTMLDRADEDPAMQEEGASPEGFLGAQRNLQDLRMLTQQICPEDGQSRRERFIRQYKEMSEATKAGREDK